MKIIRTLKIWLLFPEWYRVTLQKVILYLDQWHKCPLVFTSDFPTQQLWDTKAHFRWGPGSKFLEPIWTHFKQSESLSWALPWTLTCILGLQIMSSPLSSFFLGLKPEPIDIPCKMVPCRFSLNLPLFGYGSNLWLWNRIALFHWTLDPHLKWL
jgi:hypothetical protein